MTLGELYDMLEELKSAHDDKAASERALTFGGNDETMRRKAKVLKMDEDKIEALRLQRIS